MSQARNAIQAYNTALNATSSNIANMNVTGYKRIDVSFQSIFERVLNRGTAAQGEMGGTNPRQFGQGMAVSNVTVDFSSGEYTSGSNLDLAVSGQGLFILSPDGGDSYLYSRAGNFKIDANGNLIMNGMQVYGLDSSDSLVPITGLSGYDPNLLSWTDAGKLVQYTNTNYTDIDVETPYRIALTCFPNPGGLAQGPGTTFAETPASGIPATAQSIGGTVGTVLPRQLEQSNVFYLGETLDATEYQRAMESNLSVVRMASDMISQFINRLS
jgi:flagellar hook protein FlgE